MPSVTTNSWLGDLGAFPRDVADGIVSAIVAGAPFAGSLTRRTSRGDLVFPTITTVTGQGWVAEDAAIPDVTIGEGTEIVAVKKLAGIVMLTNESVDDSSFNLAGEVGRVVQEAFSRDLDTGLLTGTGVGANPLGVVGRAANVTSTTLVGGIAAAVGAIGESGGTPTHVAMSPTAYAVELGRETTAGPVHANGLASLLGLTVVRVPALASPLVFDTNGVYLVVGRDWSVTPSTDYAPAFQYDRTALRITGRFAVGVPVLAKAIRKITVTP